MSLEGKFSPGEFDGGVLCQGEVVLSKEQDRLLAKKSWLYLWEYLMRNDERVKATRLVVPWNLQEDKDIERAAKESADFINQRFSSPQGVIEYQRGVSKNYNQEHFDTTEMTLVKKSPRIQWMMDQVIAENPLTVLDVGAGYGNVSVALARLGVCITAIVNCEEETLFAKKYIEEESLPLEWITGILETTDFGKRQFDVVMACEVIEHVADPMSFLQKCCDLAKKAVIITTPFGSCDHGWVPNADWRNNCAHVRAFSQRSFEQLLGSLTGVKLDGKTRKILAISNYLKENVFCLCAKLVKTEVLKNVSAEIVAPKLA